MFEESWPYFSAIFFSGFFLFHAQMCLSEVIFAKAKKSRSTANKTGTLHFTKAQTFNKHGCALFKEKPQTFFCEIIRTIMFLAVRKSENHQPKFFFVFTDGKYNPSCGKHVGFSPPHLFPPRSLGQTRWFRKRKHKPHRQLSPYGAP